MKGKIAEIFESNQGEGIYVGEKQIFVRFFGCNLECSFCDTRLNSFTEYEPEELFEELKQHKGKFHSISFTGGEPLLQKDFLKLLLKLTRKACFQNYLETNGTLYKELEEVIDYLHIISMDLKLPSSTGLKGFWQEHRRFLEIASSKEVFLKTVICHSTNESDIREAIKLIKEINIFAILILQPNCFEDQSLLSEKIEDFKDICADEKVTTCIIPQVHKILGVK